MQLRKRCHGGIAKLRVDWGRAIDVCEVAAGGGQQGRVAERAGVCSWCDEPLMETVGHGCICF